MTLSELTLPHRLATKYRPNVPVIWHSKVGDTLRIPWEVTLTTSFAVTVQDAAAGSYTFTCSKSGDSRQYGINVPDGCNQKMYGISSVGAGHSVPMGVLMLYISDVRPASETWCVNYSYGYIRLESSTKVVNGKTYYVSAFISTESRFAVSGSGYSPPLPMISPFSAWDGLDISGLVAGSSSGGSGGSGSGGGLTV